MRLLRSGLLLSVGLAGLTPAGATAEEIFEDSTIVVTATRDLGYLALDAASATRTDTSLLDVPQSITVLTRQRLDDQAMLSIGDALRYTPGTSAAQGEGNRDQIVLRGNNTTSSFFVDGLRDDVQFYRDFYNVERLEILKGPNALIFGRGGGGGVINRVSKAPVAEGFVAGDAAVDTFGGWRLGADLGAPLGAGFTARLAAVYEDGANHRDAYDLERYAVNPTVALDLGGRGRIVAGYEFAHDARTTDRGIPSQGGRPLAGFRDAFFGDPAINEARLEAHILSVNADYRLTDSLTLRQRARWGDYDKFYANVFAVSAVNAGRIGIEAYGDGTQRQNLLSQTDLEWRGSTGGIGHVVLAGLELGRQTTRSQRVNGFFDAVANTARVSVAVSDPLVVPPVFFRAGPGNRSVRTVADSVAVFVQDQISLGEHVEVLAGLRYDKFALDFDNLLVPGTRFSRTDHLWSPRLGLVVKPVANASLYASFSRSYLPQSGDQFLSLDGSLATLEPEKFDNYEIGAKWDVTPGLNLTAAIYRLDRTNTRAPGAVAGTIDLTGSQRSEGLELAANGQLTPNWQISAGFAWQDAEITTTTTAAPAGRKVPLVPEIQASLWTRYDIGRFGGGLGIVHQGESFAATSNAVVLPSYTRIDAALFFKLTDAIEAQVNIENVFDTGYFPTAHTDNNISTGGPRSARFTLRTRF